MEKQRELTGKDQWLVFKRLLGYLLPHKKMVALAMGLLVLTVIGDVLGPILIKTFIDDYLTPGNFPTGPVVGLAVAYVFIQASNVVISYFQLLKFQEAALKIIQQLRIDVFTKVQNLGMRYFDRTPAGSIVSRVTNDTEAIKEMFVSVLIGFLQSAFLVVGVYIAMFILNVRLALITVVLLPILGWIIYLYRKYSSVFYQDLRERLGQLNAKLSESIQGMGMIQAFGQESRLQDEFTDINSQHWQAGKRNIKIDGLLLRPAIDLVYALALIMVLSYFGITSFSNTVEVGVIYAFVTYIDRFFEPINQVMQRLSIFQQAIVAASRVFALLDEEDLVPKQAGTAGEISKGEIEFRNVTFSYDGQTNVLKNISFKALPGQTVALVGHTGSGKSSIINLLLRFYEFSDGDILIDGQSVKEYAAAELRNKIGLVLQDPFLFYGTIESNIRLHNSAMTDEEVRAAAQFVQADKFINKLPDGFHQKVTERGSTFSSGQRQLVAFARTMAADPKILVLDEATANIDTETEVAIQQGLERMRLGRTTIAIAHRLSTIQDADLILVLHHGEIVERGTHQQLLAHRGLYHKMYLLQNGIVETAKR
ncbi:ABC transporter transmembrane domain-containing protein [Planococcus sp. APC 3906]|uniref:ABC transporter ATP-binding protein n=1 Tax=Planococcus sp. APC 3906 TaxID=3035194 RepID=UPI0025B5E46A|nr:ABC transporter transmembrane domain-containing protein [Planococcus sp. APC 3906]MDN3451495.1 ABC transporter transmembrane domain-containing protein [Planococcus sp. APC 3906]